MREIGQINSNLCEKISVFHYNQRYIIKFENSDYEQTYKVREGGSINNMEDVKRMVNDDFVITIMERFKSMHADFVQALTGTIDTDDDDEFDVIL